MIQKGYWIRILHQFAPQDHRPSMSIPESEHFYRVEIDNSDCPAEGDGKTIEEAKKNFFESFRHYQMNDPELIPPLQSSTDKHTGLNNAQYEFIAMEDVEAA